MIRTKGFTLIELLTVIAIIAILAAITFPIMGRVRDSAYRNSDTSNLNALRSALALYKVDQGGYPPAILGYASLYMSGPPNTVVPADQAIGFMYPRRVDALKTLQPAMDRVDIKLYTTAVWPNQDARPYKSAPVFDLNGDGIVDTTGKTPTGCTDPNCFYDDDSRARQAFGPTTTVVRPLPDPLGDAAANRNELIDPTLSDCPGDTPGSNKCIKAQFYNVSGYDVATVTLPGDTKQVELRYALFWTRWGLGADGTPSISVGSSKGNAHDDPRQLGYDDPPENTVLTWDSFFREYDNGASPWNSGATYNEGDRVVGSDGKIYRSIVPSNTGNDPTSSPSSWIVTSLVSHVKRDIVLFLGGGAKPADSLDVSDRSWRFTP